MLGIPLLLLLSSLAATMPSTVSAQPGVERHLGFAFPERVADFTRQGYEVHPDTRIGAIAVYRRRPTDRLIITVSALHAPRSRKGRVRSARKQARRELRALLDRYEGAYRARWPAELVVPQRPGVEVHQGVIKIHDRAANSYLFFLQIYDYGATRLRVQFSYPVERYEASLQVRDFLAAFPFP
jgi:hypothetical protein